MISSLKSTVQLGEHSLWSIYT